MSNKTKIEDGGAAFPHIADVIETSEDSIITRKITSGGMSLRDYACIQLKVPETDKEWLNEIIRKSSKTDLSVTRAEQNFLPEVIKVDL